MGGSESTVIQVQFNRPTQFYYAGEQISGNISFQNTRDKLTLDEIFLEFIGELGYTTRETRHRTDANGRSSTEHYTAYHQVPFLTNRIPIVQPAYGQNELTLYQGQYSWPFEFVLPQCMPPSSVPSTINYPYVKYYTRIVLDKPWYKPNTKQVYPITVFPHVHLDHIHTAQQPVPFSHSNRKKVNLQGYLVQGGVVPGGRLAVQVDLQNPKRSEIKRIEATLYQHRNVAQTHHAEVIFRMDLPGLSEFNDTQFHQTFDLPIPAVQLAPTYTYMPQCCGRSLAISYHYELKLDVKARGLFTDFKVNVPVIVGTDSSLSFETPPLMNTYEDMSTPSAPGYDYEDLPPSYESIMSNTKT